MAIKVCKGYTGERKKYRENGCTDCGNYQFWNGGGIMPDGHFCRLKKYFVGVIPFCRGEATE